MELDNCHSPTQPQHELEPDLIMGMNPPPPPTHQEVLRHFQLERRPQKKMEDNLKKEFKKLKTT